MKYYVNEIECDADTFETLLEKAIRQESRHATYNEMLCDGYGYIEIGQIRFYADEILEHLDPIAYDEGFEDWISAEIEDIHWTIENDADGYIVNDIQFQMVDDED